MEGGQRARLGGLRASPSPSILLRLCSSTQSARPPGPLQRPAPWATHVTISKPVVSWPEVGSTLVTSRMVGAPGTPTAAMAVSRVYCPVTSSPSTSVFTGATATCSTQHARSGEVSRHAQTRPGAGRRAWGGRQTPCLPPKLPATDCKAECRTHSSRSLRRRPAAPAHRVAAGVQRAGDGEGSLRGADSVGDGRIHSHMAGHHVVHAGVVLDVQSVLVPEF